MGMANLVPGISGGTMLLAAGVFPHFIQAVADVSRVRFHQRSLILLGTIVLSAGLVIGSLAGIVGALVVDYTWIMYSLFIGLTLGGVPLIWKMAGAKTPAFAVGALAGFIFMIGLGLLQMQGAGEGGGKDGFMLLFVAGTAGASAMVLPGVSGGYLLLLLGVYVTILESIGRIFDGVRALDISMILPPALYVALPVGLGVLLGIVGVSNLVKWVLERFPRPTLGVLFGLLLGAVLGLWPFQEGVEPEAGTILKGQTVVQLDGQLVYEQTGAQVATKDYPYEFFAPSAGQAGASVILVLCGFAITAAVAYIGRDRSDSSETAA